MPPKAPANNVKSLFSALRGADGPLTLACLCEQTGLSFSTVYRIVTQLCQKSLCRMPEKKKGGSGRNSGLFSLNGAYACVAGVYLERDLAYLSLMDFAGGMLGTSRIALENGRGVKAHQQQLFAGIDALMKAGVPRGEAMPPLAGIGIGISGRILQREAGACIHATGFPPWEKDAYLAGIRQKYGVEAWLENDSTVFLSCAARLPAYKSFKNIVFLQIDAGLGASALLDGKLYQGRHKMAGELYHLPLALHQRPAPPPQRQGEALRPSPLAEQYGLRTLKRQAAECLATRAQAGGAPQSVTVAALDALAQAGDAEMIALLSQPAAGWANIACILHCCYDPDLILVNIGMESEPAFLFGQFARLVRQGADCPIPLAYLDGALLQDKAAALFGLEHVYDAVRAGLK